MHDNMLCKLSGLCDGILPFAGSAVAFIALMAVLTL